MQFSRRHLVLGPLALAAAGFPRSILAAAPPGKSSRSTNAPDSEQRRRRAIERGLQFVYRSARVPANFALHGDDFLWCLYTIANTAADPGIAQLARRMGRERAQAWRRLHPAVPADADGEVIASLAFGSYAADRLGLVDTRMHADLQRAAAPLQATDFLDFDPAHELPPGDLPDTCTRCRNDNERGIRRCTTCGNTLEMKGAYEVLCDALTNSYIGERYGVRLGASFPDVAGLIPRMRPYRGYEDGNNPDFLPIAYAVTHIVYTLNDYGTWRLRPDWLPQEYEFLRTNLPACIALGDPDATGEFLDSLKAFGLTHDDALIRSGLDYLLQTQNRDGSWGNIGDRDIYQRYHPTWTAVDGLRDFAFRGEGVSFPAALERAQS